MRSAQNTITNNAGATMTAVNNVISGEEVDADSENVEGTTITNSEQCTAMMQESFIYIVEQILPQLQIIHRCNV